MDLKGKVALVTGGSGDVGGVIARVLAAAGVDVAISYAGNLEGADTAVEAVQATGRRSLVVQLDQRDPETINSVVDKVVGKFGQVDILVNNAAWNIGIPFTDLDTLTAEIWDRVQETNTRGPYLLARAFAPHLRAHGAGRIVNIASAAGLFPVTGLSATGAVRPSVHRSWPGLPFGSVAAAVPQRHWGTLPARPRHLP